MLIDKLSKTSSSSRLFVGLSTIVIFGIAIYNWAVSPQTNYLQAAQQYEDIMGDSKLKIMSLKKRIAVESKKNDTLVSEVQMIRSRLFTPEDSVAFFGSLEDIAEQNGATLESFNYIKSGKRNKQTASEDPAIVTPKTARVNIKGSFTGIRNFIKTLEDCSKDITVLEVNVSTGKNSSGSMLNCNIVLKILIIEETENPSNV